MKDKIMKVLSFKQLFYVLILFFLTQNSYSAEVNNSWSCPPNYTDILKKAGNGDKKAQEEICKLIYKGTLRLPQIGNKTQENLFSWLKDIYPQDSFEKKMSSLFYNRGDVYYAKECLKEVKRRAENGDSYAQRTMGSFYFYTELGSNDIDAAIKWYKKAAEQGNARAQISLALRYLDGVQVKKDVSEGMKWLVKAANSGLPEAQRTLGMFYLEGINVEIDVNKGYELLLSAARNGDDNAQLSLALHHLENASLPRNQNVETGIDWLETAFESGNIDAMYFYGYFVYLGKHFTQNKKEGLSLIKRAASLENKRAIKFLIDFKSADEIE